MTIDHIMPKSQGGGSTFENCVACCRTCNVIKGNRTPSEARMYLRKRPFQPTISEFMRIKFKRLSLDDLWEHLGEQSGEMLQEQDG
jgi:CRISPR/Cas system Type II protein with McrA/HNH and RuvC-like nuclease domain